MHPIRAIAKSQKLQVYNHKIAERAIRLKIKLRKVPEVLDWFFY